MDAQINIFTVQRLDDFEFLWKTICFFEQLFEAKFMHDVAEIESERERAIPISEQGMKEDAQKYSSVILFSQDRSIRVLFSWNRLRGADAHRNIEAMGFLPNRLQVTFPRERIDLADGIKLVKRLHLEVKAFYSFLSKANIPLFPVNQKCFSAGLLDLHWLNIYGEPFAEIFTEKQLGNIAPCSFEKLSEVDYVLHFKIGLEEFYGSGYDREKMRMLLGRQYFVTEKQAPVEAGRFNLFSYLLKAVFSSKDEVIIEAEIRPEIDYSEVYCLESTRGPRGE